jgi:hypothetical protein
MRLPYCFHLRYAGPKCAAGVRRTFEEGCRITTFDPSRDNASVVAALMAQKRLHDAMQTGDVAAIDALFASDLVVNAPINRYVDRENVMARYRSGQISYEPDVTRNIEFAGVRADSVVIMGEEIARPNAGAPHAGKTVHRRFTDIWREIDGAWKMCVRQATITSVG